MNGSPRRAASTIGTGKRTRSTSHGSGSRRHGVAQCDHADDGDRDHPHDRGRPPCSRCDDVGERCGQQRCARRRRRRRRPRRAPARRACPGRTRARAASLAANTSRAASGFAERIHPRPATTSRMRGHPSPTRLGGGEQGDDERDHRCEHRRYDERDAIARGAEAHERPGDEQQRASGRDPHPRTIPRCRETHVGCREPRDERDECTHCERRSDGDVCRADRRSRSSAARCAGRAHDRRRRARARRRSSTATARRSRIPASMRAPHRACRPPRAPG